MATDPRIPAGAALTGRSVAQSSAESPAALVARYAARLAALPDIAPLLEAARKRPPTVPHAESVALLTALDAAQRAVRIALNQAGKAAP